MFHTFFFFFYLNFDRYWCRYDLNRPISTVSANTTRFSSNWHELGNEKKKNATQHQCASSGVTRRTLHQTPVQHLYSRISASKSFSLMHLLHHLVMGGLRPNMLRACHHSNTSLFFYLAKPITSILLFAPI